ncbi:hypothetical protein Tco_1450421 [Tanacetum coccineum]
MIWLRAEAPSTSHSLLLPSTYHLTPPLGTPSPLPIPALTSSPPLLLPSTSRRKDRPEVTSPPQKRLGIALGPTYEVGESSSTVAARLARGLRADYSFVATMDREIRRDLERLVTKVAELSQRMTKFETRVRQETDEAWGRSMDVSDLARAEVMSLHTTVLGQQIEITELRATDRKRQTVIIELLAADYKRQRQLTKALKLLKGLQTQMAELQRQ